MEEPLRQIVTNAGDEASVVLHKVADGEGNYGYNAATGEYGDMVEHGHPRPDQGHPHRAAERRLRGRPDDHHRGM
jgi:hypothetical protein